MVKRYSPSYVTKFADYTNDVEVTAKMKRDPMGNFVSYEAYRLLKKQHDKLVKEISSKE